MSRFISWVNSFSDIRRKCILPNLIRAVKRLHSLYWSIHTKDESKRETAFASIFGVNWLWLTTPIIFGKIPLPANVRKLVFFIWNKAWRNYKFAWNSWKVLDSIVASFFFYSKFNQWLLSLSWFFNPFFCMELLA